MTGLNTKRVLLTSSDTVFCLGLYGLAVLVNCWIQREKLLDRDTVCLREFGTGIIVYILASWDRKSANNIARSCMYHENEQRSNKGGEYLHNCEYVDPG